uniref:Retroviral polymerase SH3-like domain-containing protein n=1 Tax=Ananas comosus var. bracteatus TaxID=296719 RepID=A0A6V7NVQ7_ANACO|nr:unnamed protein product [Ananas comosus var. bracteatus]
MLSHSGLPKSFWAEAANTAIYLINRSASVALDGDISEIIWSGKDISYGHLRIFGCEAYIHIPKESRTKLDVKSRKCVFLGYGGDELGYRLWDPVVRKTIRSRDVVFREDVMFKEGTEEEQKKDKLVVDVQVDGSSQDIHEVHPPLYDSDVGHDDNVDHEESTQSSESRHDSHESENDMSTPPAHDLRRSTRLHKPIQRKHSGLIET